MLWYVTAYRDRLSLRLNGNQKWRIQTENGWIRIDSQVFGSITAVVKGQSNGTKITIASRPGHRQVLILANTCSNRAIGSITIRDDGALQVLDSPSFDATEPLPFYWRDKVLAVIGMAGHGTMNITDQQGNDEDIIRLRPNAEKIIVPRHYINATRSYDVDSVNSNANVVVDDTENGDDSDQASQASNETFATSSQSLVGGVVNEQALEEEDDMVQMPQLVGRNEFDDAE